MNSSTCRIRTPQPLYNGLHAAPTPAPTPHPPMRPRRTFSQVTSRDVSRSSARCRSRLLSMMPAVRAPSSGSGDSQICSTGGVTRLTSHHETVAGRMTSGCTVYAAVEGNTDALPTTLSPLVEDAAH